MSALIFEGEEEEEYEEMEGGNEKGEVNGVEK